MSKVVKQPSGCWEWQAAKYAKGYGAFVIRNETRRAHRVLYVWTYGEPDADLHHRCENRSCVNPDHLEPVTEQNVPPRHRLSHWDFCSHGHPQPENTIIDERGWRQCRICRNDRARVRARANAETINARKRELRALVVREQKTCEQCGVLFTPGRSDARFCSQACGQRSRYRRRQST
jgi:hypothetical protein